MKKHLTEKYPTEIERAAAEIIHQYDLNKVFGVRRTLPMIILPYFTAYAERKSKERKSA